MNNPETKQGNFKKKIVHELGEYLIIVCYLTLVFAAFTQYRRILLSAYGIDYMNYGVAVIEALILGKVVMIGDILRLGRGLEQKPLIYPTLLKTFVFTVFVAAFTLIEHAIKGLWQGKGLTGGLIELSEKGYHELLANSLVVFVAFIPFFAVKELQRVFGVGELRALFFKNRVDP
jgi:hypothetical protein